VIFLDVTQASRSAHFSGLNRVSARLRSAGSDFVTPIRWREWSGELGPGDCLLTSELFSDEERPGIRAWLARRGGRAVAVFHDAIPLRHPGITWARSVGRHAAYVKLLAEFDDVLAVSADSARDLGELWRWQGVVPRARISVIALGADGLGTPRASLPATMPPRNVVAVGILEPRKNQTVLLNAAERLWRRGRLFRLFVVGRVNPHFGGPIARHMAALARSYPGLVVHEARLDDARLAERLDGARCTAFPSLAEGCGLPVLESLWAGRPCLCGDVAAIRESASGGGCEVLPPHDVAAWEEALERMLFDDAHWRARTRESTERPLPRWRGTITAVLQACRGSGAAAGAGA
jgi:glycosyltransferase involved in cell wall biosynthesis